MNKGQFKKLIIICSIIISFLCLSGCVDDNGNDDGDKDLEDDWRKWPIVKGDIEQWNGYNNENSEEIIIFNLTEKYVTRIIFELNWSDEDDASARHINQPDSFNLSIITPWEQIINSDKEVNGQINLTFQIPEDIIKSSELIGEWTVIIHCGQCGDHELIRPEIGLRNISDDGNDWTLSYYYEYHSEG